MQKRKNKGRFGDETSQRQLRVSELIKRNISKILLDSDFYDQDGKNYSASVSEVRCSSDLKIATVYVLPLNKIDPQELTSFLEERLLPVQLQRPCLRESHLRVRVISLFDQLNF